MRRGKYIGDAPAFGGVTYGAVQFFSAPPATGYYQACDGSQMLFSNLPGAFKPLAPVGPMYNRALTVGGSLTGLGVSGWQENCAPFVVSGVLYFATQSNSQAISLSADGMTMSKAFLGELASGAGVKDAYGLLYCGGKFWSVRSDPAFSSNSNAGRRIYSATTLAGPWTASTNVGSNVFEKFNNSSTWQTTLIHDMVTDGGSNYCVVCTDKIIATSPDAGANWTRRLGGLTGDYSVRCVIFNGTEFVCYTTAGFHYIPVSNLATLTTYNYSSDTTKYPGSAGPTIVFKVGTTYYGYHEANTSTCYWTSSDGKNWTKQVTAFNCNAMCYDAVLDRIYAFSSHATAPELRWMPGNGGFGGSWTQELISNPPLGLPSYVRLTANAGRLLVQQNGVAFSSFNDKSLWYDFPVIAAIGVNNAYMRIK